MIAGNFFRALAVCVLSAGALSLSGCATVYVDGALKDTNASQVRKPARPQDAQLFFTFQSKGVANAKATELLKRDVIDAVGASGLFAVVGTEPALSGSVLNVSINNIPVTEDAFSKGFVTGLTFGLAGSAVSDGYVCTIDYLPPSGKGRITKTSRHAIHTTMGAKGAPPNAIKAKSIDDAVHTMTRQVVTEALKGLSQEAVFQ